MRYCLILATFVTKNISYKAIIKMENGKDKDETKKDEESASDNAKSPPLKENLISYISQYCNATSIYGIRYIAESGRPISEKSFWISSITSFWSLCVVLLIQTYSKWKASPTIVTFSTAEIPISDIPFPAITVCPYIRHDPGIFNYTNVLIKKVFDRPDITEEENEYFESLSLLYPSLGNLSLFGVDDNGSLTVGANIIEHLTKASPYTKENLTVSYWQSLERQDLLPQVVGSCGLSFNFNILDFSEIFTEVRNNNTAYSFDAIPKRKGWTMDEGYSKEEFSETYPKRSFVAGPEGGFTFAGAVSVKELPPSYETPFAGYQVALHHPSELPNMDKRFLLPLNQVVLVGIKPKITTISEKLKSYKLEDRKCYLNNERKLKIFKYYTRQNCLEECFLNYTWEACKCRPFYMYVYDDAPLCGRGSKSCLSQFKKSYQDRNKCNCLPSCTSLEYDVEISQGDLKYYRDYLNIFAKLKEKNLKFEKNSSGWYMSYLAVYYKDEQFWAIERKEYYEFFDFMANVGGLLGLFIGFSAASMIEIIYFLTFRLTTNIQQYGIKFWSGAPEVVGDEADK